MHNSVVVAVGCSYVFAQGCGWMTSCQPRLRCVAVCSSSDGIKTKAPASAESHRGALPCPLGHDMDITCSTALSQISSFRNASRHGLNIDFFSSFAPKKKCWVFLGFFNGKRLEYQLPTWDGSAQSSTVLSAGTKRSVSNHVWQHIKLHSYLSFRLASPLVHSHSLESNMLFSIWKAGKIGERENHWDSEEKKWD